MIAIEYAKKYPSFVSHLILVASSPITGAMLYQEANIYFERSASLERKALLEQNLTSWNKLDQSNTFHPFISRMLQFAPMIWYQHDYNACHLWDGVVLNDQGANYIWGDMFKDYDIKIGLESITCPVFLGLGRHDYWNPPHLWDSIHQHFSKLTIHLFEKSGHTPQFEEAAFFDKTLIKWLSTSK